MMTPEVPPPPPLGVIPNKIWAERISRERFYEITAAMERYTLVDKAVPLIWIDELRELYNRTPR